MVNRPDRKPDGLYHVKGAKYPELIGSRAQVWHRTAYKTSGGLTRNALLMNKKGEIVSATKSKTARREKRLERAGYKTEPGKFKLFTPETRKRKTRKNR